MRPFRWLWSKLVKFLKWLWALIKSFGTVKGIISLFISFSLFYGWLLVFIVIGIIWNDPWFYGVGITGVLFWAGPFTPLIPLMLGFATILRKFVFKDKNISHEDEKEDTDDFDEEL